MNWIKKTIRFGEKIKKIIKKRSSKEEIENSDWPSSKPCVGLNMAGIKEAWPFRKEDISFLCVVSYIRVYPQLLIRAGPGARVVLLPVSVGPPASGYTSFGRLAIVS